MSQQMSDSIRCGQLNTTHLNNPDHWVTSGGLGTMGFGFPAAIGAQIAKPDKRVVAIVGDAGFQMTAQELSLLQELRIPVKIVILNNEALGMVRQWQETFYEKRYSQSLIPVQPNFVKLAEAYDIKGYRIETLEEAEAVFQEALLSDEPVSHRLSRETAGKRLSDGCTRQRIT